MSMSREQSLREDTKQKINSVYYLAEEMLEYCKILRDYAENADIARVEEANEILRKARDTLDITDKFRACVGRIFAWTAKLEKGEKGWKVVFDDGLEYSVMIGVEVGDTSGSSDMVFLFDEEGQMFDWGCGLSEEDIVEICEGHRR